CRCPFLASASLLLSVSLSFHHTHTHTHTPHTHTQTHTHTHTPLTNIPALIHHRLVGTDTHLSLEEQQELRRKINSRERKRMQDLNLAMDALREVMHPYLPPGASPNGRRLSKISTLVLARNYILLLGSSLQEMRRLLGEVSIGAGVGGTGPRLLLAGGWPFLAGPGQLLLTPPEQQLGPAKCSPLPLNGPPALEETTAWSSEGSAATPLCPCGACRVPRVLHVQPTSRFPK
uniref:Oligodendrocyte transcription factor 1 n=1 Tax=Electrophorus electricus TaxID=8005 RepID=A0A4W4GWC8_ELEEL